MQNLCTKYCLQIVFYDDNLLTFWSLVSVKSLWWDQMPPWSLCLSETPGRWSSVAKKALLLYVNLRQTLEHSVSVVYHKKSPHMLKHFSKQRDIVNVDSRKEVGGWFGVFRALMTWVRALYHDVEEAQQKSWTVSHAPLGAYCSPIFMHVLSVYSVRLKLEAQAGSWRRFFFTVISKNQLFNFNEKKQPNQFSRLLIHSVIYFCFAETHAYFRYLADTVNDLIGWWKRCHVMLEIWT